MKLLNKLERKFGRYAIHNLMRFIIVLYAIGLIMGSFTPGIYETFFSLDFAMIAKGQVWRLVTFMIPQVSVNELLFVALTVYLYYMIGNSLERAWGAFRFNVYFFSGLLFTILASFIVYLITGISIPTSLQYVYMTMFFAFASLYANTQFLLFFIIPVKVKYIAWFYGASIVFDMVSNIVYGIKYHSLMSILMIVPIIVSMANFLIFFFASRNYNRISPKEFQRKAAYHRQMNQARSQGNVSQFNGRNVITRHKCAVCGRTELDNEQLEFRFCSKCDGNYEYCMDHLFTHEHVKR